MTKNAENETKNADSFDGGQAMLRSDTYDSPGGAAS
jgi:hypothetical protein